MTRNWKTLSKRDFLTTFNQEMARFQLAPWSASQLQRDTLYDYCTNAGRPYVCKGTGFSWAHVDDHCIKTTYLRRRAHGESSNPWEDIGGSLIDHAQNAIVFERFVRVVTAHSPQSPLYLWCEEPLDEPDEDEGGFYQIPGMAWTAFCDVQGDLSFWLSFDMDKILFAPRFAVALVAFHHECFELAGLAGNPEQIWTHMETLAS